MDAAPWVTGAGVGGALRSSRRARSRACWRRGWWLVHGPRVRSPSSARRAGVERDVGVAAVGVGQLDRRRPARTTASAVTARSQRRSAGLASSAGLGQPVDLQEALPGVEHEPVAVALEPVGPGGQDRRPLAQGAAVRGVEARGLLGAGAARAAGGRRRRSRAPARRARRPGDASARRSSSPAASGAPAGRQRIQRAAARRSRRSRPGPSPAIGSPAASASRPWQRAASASRRTGSGGSGSSTVAANAATVASAAATRCSHAAQRAHDRASDPPSSPAEVAALVAAVAMAVSVSVERVNSWPLRALARAAGGLTVFRRGLKDR